MRQMNTLQTRQYTIFAALRWAYHTGDLLNYI